MAIHINQMPQSVKDKLGYKDKAYQQFWAVIGDKKKIYFRSSWEYMYACWLEKLKQGGKIKDWEHEPVTFWFNKIKRGVRSYLPDFRVTHLDGSIEFVETKGFFDSRSKTKMKRMEKYYPEVKLKMIGQEWFLKNMKSLKVISGLYSVIVKK